MLSKGETGSQVVQGDLKMSNEELNQLYTEISKVLPTLRANASRAVISIVDAATVMGLVTKITVYKGIHTVTFEGEVHGQRVCRVGNARTMNHAAVRAFAAIIKDIPELN